MSGYEGSPLGGYDLELARQRGLLSEYGIVHQPGLNEELAATSVSGSQLAGRVGDAKHDGVTGVWYGKAPGLDRATDALRHANMIGTSPTGGAVALVGDDPAAKSSTLPCSSEMALAGLALPTFYPADPAEALVHGHARGRTVPRQRAVVRHEGGHRDGRRRVHRPGQPALAGPRPVGPAGRPARLRPPAARPAARRGARRA